MLYNISMEHILFAGKRKEKNHVAMPTDLNITTWSTIIQGFISKDHSIPKRILSPSTKTDK